MILLDAINKANQIFEEERLHPTIQYVLAPKAPARVNPTAQAIAEIAEVVRAAEFIRGLPSWRAKLPRDIMEDSNEYVIQSRNLELIKALRNQLADADRESFLSLVVSHVAIAPAATQTQTTSYLAWHGLSSHLPLVLEFAVRSHGKQQLITSLTGLEAFPAHILLLRQLAELISFDFTLFSEAEYEDLVTALKSLQSSADQKKIPGRGANFAVLTLPDPTRASDVALAMDEISSLISGVLAQCRKARYLYLRRELEEGLNVEINQDKLEVQSYLKQLGFSQSLIAALDEVDRLIHPGATTFDFKNCVGILRSFLEVLHIEAAARMSAAAGTQAPTRWGDSLIFLKNNRVLTKPEEEFASALYRLMSDQAVHPLVAEREYARLARNVVVEYGLLVLRIVEKKQPLPQANRASSLP